MPNARRISANHITNSGWITSVPPVFMPRNPSVPPVFCEMLYLIDSTKHLIRLVSCIFRTESSSASNRDITWETVCHRDFWCEQEGYFFLRFLRIHDGSHENALFLFTYHSIPCEMSRFKPCSRLNTQSPSHNLLYDGVTLRRGPGIRDLPQSHSLSSQLLHKRLSYSPSLQVLWSESLFLSRWLFNT